MVNYQINPKNKPSMIYVGQERSPVLIIDDFLLNTQPVVDFACQQAFVVGQEHNNSYPGIRSAIGDDYGMTVLKAIAPYFYNTLKIPPNLTLTPYNGCYSLITQAESTLELRQCIPHFDNDNIYSFAALHYLNKGDFGGTAFYRHKPTGFENITNSRKEEFFNSAQQYIEKNGHTEHKYFTESTGHFELLEVIDYKPNRFIIYPSTLLHSAYLKQPDNNIDDNPATGRLTANFFIEFK
ncbi:DUF6445 family protein [Thalassotalea agariperforans]